MQIALLAVCLTATDPQAQHNCELALWKRPQGTYSATLAFLRQHQCYLDKIEGLIPDNIHAEMKAETQRLYVIYDAADDLCFVDGCGVHYADWRERAMRTLKRHLSIQDFYSGRLPPPIPSYFQRID